MAVAHVIPTSRAYLDRLVAAAKHGTDPRMRKPVMKRTADQKHALVFLCLHTRPSSQAHVRCLSHSMTSYRILKGSSCTSPALAALALPLPRVFLVFGTESRPMADRCRWARGCAITCKKALTTEPTTSRWGHAKVTLNNYLY